MDDHERELIALYPELRTLAQFQVAHAYEAGALTLGERNDAFDQLARQGHPFRLVRGGYLPRP